MEGCNNGWIYNWWYHLGYNDASYTTLPPKQTAGFPLGRANITSYMRLLGFLSSGGQTNGTLPWISFCPFGPLYLTCSSLDSRHATPYCLFPTRGVSLFLTHLNWCIRLTGALHSLGETALPLPTPCWVPWGPALPMVNDILLLPPTDKQEHTEPAESEC